MDIVSEHPEIIKDGIENIDIPLLLKYAQPIEILQEAIAQLGSVSTFLPNNASLVSQQCYDDVIDMIDLVLAGKDTAIASKKQEIFKFKFKNIYFTSIEKQVLTTNTNLSIQLPGNYTCTRAECVGE